MERIRKATAADSQVAWDIRNTAIRHGCRGFYDPEHLAIWTQGELTEKFSRFVGQWCYVTEIDGYVVATGMLDNETAKIEALFVHPDFMGAGIARRLLRHLESLALAQGMETLSLESTLNAVPFYRACGYEGESISNYYSPRGIVLDCVLMHKTLHRLSQG